MQFLRKLKKLMHQDALPTGFYIGKRTSGYAEHPGKVFLLELEFFTAGLYFRADEFVDWVWSHCLLIHADENRVNVTRNVHNTRTICACIS